MLLRGYNCHFNGIVPSSHPNLVVFANALKNKAIPVSQHLEDVRKGCEEAPTYSTKFIEIPNKFHSFKWPPVASKNCKVKKWWCVSSGSGHVCYLCGGCCFSGIFKKNWGFIFPENIHQVRLDLLFKIASSIIFLQQNSPCYFHFSWTMSPCPICAVEIWVLEESLTGCEISIRCVLISSLKWHPTSFWVLGESLTGCEISIGCVLISSSKWYPTSFCCDFWVLGELEYVKYLSSSKTLSKNNKCVYY